MLNQKETENISIINKLELDQILPKSKQNFWLKIVSDGLGTPISIPILVARGTQKSPVLGLTAAVHGNELNGIPVIQRLFKEIDVENLKGTIIGVPVVNVPAFIRKKRRFNDSVDLNHIMPGVETGNVSQVYAFRFLNKIIKKFDFLLDLHTASFGRINSFYIRADMDVPEVKELAQLQNADIIVHNPPSDGTLRGAADELNIPAITLELGNPNTFQKKLIKSGVEGIHNTLVYLKMIDDKITLPKTETVLCKKSYWIYTDEGGLLSVHVDLREFVKKGKLVASIRDIFGNLLKHYYAPEDGVVIGKSISPVNQTGGRILHLGIV